MKSRRPDAGVVFPCGTTAPPSVQSASRAGHRSDKPRQLPAAIRHFVGRDKELTALSDLPAQATEARGAIVISAIGGTAGVGKTALAVHWAHLHADRYPDGQLYLNLRGFDPSGAPMPPADALRRFLATLGVPGHRIPADLDEQRRLVACDIGHRADQAQQRHPCRPRGSTRSITTPDRYGNSTSKIE